MKTAISIAVGLAMFASQAFAADVGGEQCVISGNSTLLTIQSNAELTDEVVRLMNEAVNVADSSQWIDSRRPAFVWASEAKVACGKAFGYLRSSYRDEDYINRCECFHQRMRSYMY